MTEHKDNAGVRIHPPVLMLLHLGLALLLGWLIPLPLPATLSTKIAGWVIVAAWFAFAFGALGELIRAHTSPDPHAPTTRVVTWGPYRFSRNPVYVGFTSLVIGIPLGLGSYWGFLILPLMIYLFQKWIIFREENYLEGKFEQEYLAYKARVRRWL